MVTTGGIRKRPGGSKTVPYLSHEFIIQNHGDIATCACMVFIVGLMFQVRNVSSIFFLCRITTHTNTYFE
jgi:translocating chain-associated membrane protein 1